MKPRLFACIVFSIVIVSCAPAPTLTPPTTAPTTTSAPTATETFTPAPTSIPPASTPTNVSSTPTSSPTATTLPSPTSSPIPRPLEIPSDIGTSHFGVMDYAGEARQFPGEWARAHPGPFIWGAVGAKPGSYDWQNVDDLVRTFQNRRVVILATVWHFADWDEKTCHGSDPPLRSRLFGRLPDRLYAPCNPQAFAAWLTALVERYDGDGMNDMPGLQYPIRYWEVLNEPEMQASFFQGSSESYLGLLQLAYKTVKAADPKATVVLGGQAGMQSEFTRFWEPILRGARGSFDLGNIHSLGSSNVFFAPQYRDWLAQLGYKDVPFWITEAQVQNGGAPGQNWPTPDDRARALFQGYANAFANGAQVIFKVSMGSNDDMDRTFLTMAKTVGEFRGATPLPTSGVRFDLSDNRQVYALWDGARFPREVTGGVTVVTYKGDESKQNAQDVSATVPIFVLTSASTSSPATSAANPSPRASDEEGQVRNVVERFGKQLQVVSLQAADAKEQIRTQYSEFVSPDLLQKWTQDPSIAPGRVVSSPWPDRIDITSFTKKENGQYLVSGYIIQVTSMEVVSDGAVQKIPVQLTLHKPQSRWIITDFAQQ